MNQLEISEVKGSKTFKRYRQLQDEAIETMRSIALLETEEGSVEALGASLMAGVLHFGYDIQTAHKASEVVANNIKDLFFKDFYGANNTEDKLKVLLGAIGATSFAIEDGKIPGLKTKRNFKFWKRNKKSKLSPELQQALAEAIKHIEEFKTDQRKKDQAKRRFEDL